ncbi:s-adenosyl-methyltransferase mraw [Holotrichia oblita]|nr:s-adenosyl-methyltransferase mraw [Holotrichia oblita]
MKKNRTDELPKSNSHRASMQSSTAREEVRFKHIPVLHKEVLEGLNIQADKTYLDVTVGGGGHSSLIAAKLGKAGKLICLDKDDAALEASKLKLKQFSNVTIVKSDFKDFKDVLGETKFDGILADLGVSSHQIDTAERGFSYRFDGPLDMRMDTTQELTAEIVVNTYEEKKLADIIYQYGEEKLSRRIAWAIVKARPIATTGELVKVITKAVPGSYFYKTGRHPATLTFQAIRIEVNGELEGLAQFVEDAADALNQNGRLAIISFHSLEDRIVKQTFKKLSTDCLCPPKCPKCICGHKATVKILTSKPTTASAEEP